MKTFFIFYVNKKETVEFIKPFLEDFNQSVFHEYRVQVRWVLQWLEDQGFRPV